MSQEAVESAIKSLEHLRFIHNVPMILQSGNNGVMTGMLAIQQIVYKKINHDGEGGYVCLRYCSDGNDDAAVWIGHGTVTGTGKTVQLRVSIPHHNMSLPANMGKSLSQCSSCQISGNSGEKPSHCI